MNNAQSNTGKKLYSDCYDGSSGQKGHFSLDELTDLSNNTGKDLVRPCDIKGILHSHSRYTDGAHSIDSMVSTAREIGLDYLGISDHFQSEAHQEGLDLKAVMDQREEMDAISDTNNGFEILQGVEIDANADGTLPLDDEILGLFDYVIASFPDTKNQNEQGLTERIIKVASHPLVTILGRPVGDYMLRCNAGVVDMDAILVAAAEANTAVEVSAHPDTLEVDWTCCRRAQELGVLMAISPNAHRAARLVDIRHGAELAQEAGLRCNSIINTFCSSDLRAYLDRARPSS